MSGFTVGVIYEKCSLECRAYFTVVAFAWAQSMGLIDGRPSDHIVQLDGNFVLEAGNNHIHTQIDVRNKV